MIIIQTENLEKRYNGSVAALEDVSITIKGGEFVTLVGRSGSGKSTLLNILGGLDKPTGGSVLLHGSPVIFKDRKSLVRLRRETVGFVFQQFNLLSSLSAEENVCYPLLFNGCSRREREKRASSLLEKVGLSDRASHFPHQLSGGEQQRVAIARALVGEPEIILADEPTGNLDSRTSREIYQLMRRVNTELGTTFVVVTHERELASYSDRTIELADGRVITP